MTEAESSTGPVPTVVRPSGLDAQLFDQDAVRAVARLHAFGHEAYLVGGCVRDLLLGHRPKDFDIATSARPPLVKRTFARNCRIIGRRFKLAHLHFEGNKKILEVSTFRRAPEQEQDEDDEEQDLLIVRDNEFGTAEEDAVRRDFTINALFLDPTRDEIIDHVGGLEDIERRMLRTIGDPFVRFREDPVRILRAIKFAGRLELSIESRTATAMSEVAPDLVRAAPPRVLEEILRLLRGGHAFDGLQRMRACGALRAILPTVDEFLHTTDRASRVGFWRALEALDGRAQRAPRTRAPWPPENGVMLGCLFERVVRAAVTAQPDRGAATLAEEIVAPFAAAFRLPKRDAACVKRITALQHRFLDPEPERRWRIDALLSDPFFLPGLELFELVSMADGRALDLVELWKARYAQRFGRGHGERRPQAPAAPRPPAERAPVHERTAPATRPEPRVKQQGPSSRERHREERAAREKASRERREDKRKRREDKRNEKLNRKRAEQVEAIEPTPVDVSAFDVELDPRRVPTFGTIVDAEKKKPRRAGPVPGASDDNYRPPPPPGGDAPPLPPPPGPAERGPFGDW